VAKSGKVHIDSCTNKEAGERYNKIVDIVNNENYRMWQCSDEVTRLDLFGIKSHVLNKIKWLPETEKSAIIQRYDRFSLLKSHMARLKRKAYGTLEQGFKSVLEARKAEVLELFAMYYSVDEIHKKLLTETGLQLNIASVHRFYKKYRIEIERLQLDYDSEYGTIGISRKRSRLEILDIMLRRIRSEFDKASGKHMLPYAKEMKNILEQARKEVEGEQVHLNVDGTINITATIESAKSVEQLYSDINFMNLLISRVAARMRINPMVLNYQLTNSWYAKFTGIKRNDSLMHEVPDYPSKIILNWDNLQKKALEREKEYQDLKNKFAEDAQLLPTDEETDKAEKLRVALKERLLQKQDYVDGAKDRIRGIKK